MAGWRLLVKESLNDRIMFRVSFFLLSSSQQQLSLSSIWFVDYIRPLRVKTAISEFGREKKKTVSSQFSSTTTTTTSSRVLSSHFPEKLFFFNDLLILFSNFVRSYFQHYYFAVLFFKCMHTIGTQGVRGWPSFLQDVQQSSSGWQSNEPTFTPHVTYSSSSNNNNTDYFVIFFLRLLGYFILYFFLVFFNDQGLRGFSFFDS